MTLPIPVPPDAVRVTRDWLTSIPELETLVHDRITTRAPALPVFPYITLQQIGGIPRERRRLHRARIQISSWADFDTTVAAVQADELASLVGRTVWAAVHAMEGYRHSTAVVTAVDDELGPQSMPDTSRTPPTPRFIAGIVVFLHPVP